MYSLTEITLAVICLAQMGVIYGLVNRLIRQSGQSAMQARKAVKEAMEQAIGDDAPAREPVTQPRTVVESFKIRV